MKRIFLCRHAKSSWEDYSLPDHDRPLNSRGKRDAPLVAAELAKEVPSIDMIVSSTARRAVDTATVFRSAIDAQRYEEDRKLFHASYIEILEVISDLPEEVSSALIFGHNPGFTDVYNNFADQPIDNLPTTGLYGIESSASSWYDIDTTNTRLKYYIYPKQLLKQ